MKRSLIRIEEKSAPVDARRVRSEGGIRDEHDVLLAGRIARQILGNAHQKRARRQRVLICLVINLKPLRAIAKAYL